MTSLFNNFFPKSEEYPYEMSNSGTLLRKQKKKNEPTCSILRENDNDAESNVKTNPDTFLKVSHVDETNVETDPVTCKVPKVDETNVETDPVPCKVPEVDETQVKTDPVPSETSRVDETQVKTDPMPSETSRVDETQVKTDPVPSETSRVDETQVKTDSNTNSSIMEAVHENSNKTPVQETLEEKMDENVVKGFNVNVDPTVQEPVSEQMDEKVDENTLISKSLCDIINDEEISMFDLIDLTSSKVVPDAKLKSFFSMLQMCQTHDRRKVDKLMADINMRAQHSFTVLDLLKIHFFATNSFSFELLDEDGDIVTSILEFRPY